MFERIKAWWRGEDDTIKTPEDLQKLFGEINETRRKEGHPDLKIWTLPVLPEEPDMKIYNPEDKK